ncbi:hypothetical protein GQ44DRAFT_714015, partial [Phaeosphaeriaceae sp. PMI808]
VHSLIALTRRPTTYTRRWGMRLHAEISIASGLHFLIKREHTVPPSILSRRPIATRTYTQRIFYTKEIYIDLNF